MPTNENLVGNVYYKGVNRASAALTINDTSFELEVILVEKKPFYYINLKDEFIRVYNRTPRNGEQIRFKVPLGARFVGRVGYQVAYMHPTTNVPTYGRVYPGYAAISTTGWDTTNTIILDIEGDVIGAPMADVYSFYKEPGLPANSLGMIDRVVRRAAIESAVPMIINVAPRGNIIGGGGSGTPVHKFGPLRISMTPDDLVTEFMNGDTAIRSLNNAKIVVNNNGRICGGGGAGGMVLSNGIWGVAFGYSGGGAGFGGYTNNSLNDSMQPAPNDDYFDFVLTRRIIQTESNQYFEGTQAAWGTSGSTLAGGAGCIRQIYNGIDIESGAGGAAGLSGIPGKIYSPTGLSALVPPGTPGYIKEGNVTISNFGSGHTVGV